MGWDPPPTVPCEILVSVVDTKNSNAPMANVWVDLFRHTTLSETSSHNYLVTGISDAQGMCSFLVTAALYRIKSSVAQGGNSDALGRTTTSEPTITTDGSGSVFEVDFTYS